MKNLRAHLASLTLIIAGFCIGATAETGVVWWALAGGFLLLWVSPLIIDTAVDIAVDKMRRELWSDGEDVEADTSDVQARFCIRVGAAELAILQRAADASRIPITSYIHIAAMERATRSKGNEQGAPTISRDALSSRAEDAPVSTGDDTA